ncbi:MAG: hypothetical protein [Wigfec virus K19_227]|nr:MAG: hypothetical protein [Wigfec virus K19_227]
MDKPEAAAVSSLHEEVLEYSFEKFFQIVTILSDWWKDFERRCEDKTKLLSNKVLSVHRSLNIRYPCATRLGGVEWAKMPYMYFSTHSGQKSTPTPSSVSYVLDKMQYIMRLEHQVEAYKSYPYSYNLSFFVNLYDYIQDNFKYSDGIFNFDEYIEFNCEMKFTIYDSIGSYGINTLRS